MELLQIQHHCNVNPDFRYNRPHGLNEYVLILAQGQAYFHADGEKYLLKPYQLFIYNKGQPQLFYSTGEEFCHDWFHFDMGVDDLAFFDALGIPFGRPITPSNPFALSELIKTLAAEHRFNAPHGAEIIDMYMRCFFLKLSDMTHQPAEKNASHPYYQCLCSLRNELYSFPYHGWTLEIMSEKAHMSKSWFQHNWKEVFNCSYQEDLITSRVEYAKNLLFHSNSTIEHIAYLSGYNSDVHFMRQFKNVTGLTPSAYRKQFPVRDEEADKPKEFEQIIDFCSRKSRRP